MSNQLPPTARLTREVLDDIYRKMTDAAVSPSPYIPQHLFLTLDELANIAPMMAQMFRGRLMLAKKTNLIRETLEGKAGLKIWMTTRGDFWSPGKRFDYERARANVKDVTFHQLTCSTCWLQRFAYQHPQKESTGKPETHTTPEAIKELNALDKYIQNYLRLAYDI
jgi:hypothetical protein